MLKRYALPLMLSLLFSSSWLHADATRLEVEKVSDNVYAIIGPITNRNADNLGNNATFGLIVTDEGAVLIDSGGTYKGAQRLHQTIRSITQQPVKIVINSGGQDHRWMGNTYFKQQGARIIASAAAVEDHKARTTDQLFVLSNLVGDENMAGTENTTYADETFDESRTLTLGGEQIELHAVGAAHTPGDTFIWLPQQKILFSSDIIYVQRMLGVIPVSSSANWVSAFEKIEALAPEKIIPGHGPVTTLDRAKRESYDYLVFLRQSIGDFIDNGGTMDAISSIDQSAFSFLENFDTLSGRNAQQVFSEMEWE